MTLFWLILFGGGLVVLGMVIGILLAGLGRAAAKACANTSEGR